MPSVSAPLELCWLASASTSSFHVVDLLARRRPLADAGLTAALGLPASELVRELETLGCSLAEAGEHLLPLSAVIDGNRSLAEVVLQKTIGWGLTPRQIDQLADRLSDVEQAFVEYRPDVIDELSLRAEPLQQQWEARGPGLLRSLRKLTDAELIVESAEVILIHPAAGGGGAAHPLYNSLRFEAVLANPYAELPEVLRLGWLLAQLNADLPRFQGDLPRESVRRALALATIPAVLAAAEEVELARCEPATLAIALRVWHDEPDGAAVAEALWTWWETYREARPRWEIALAALDRMMG